MRVNSFPPEQTSMLPSTSGQAVVVVRLSDREYKEIEKKVSARVAAEYRGSDPGALGVKVGAEMVLKIIRDSIVAG